MCQELFATDGGPDLASYDDILALGYTLDELVPYSAFDNELGPNGEVPAWFTTTLCLCGFDIEEWVEARTGVKPEWDPFGYRFPTRTLVKR